MEDDPFGFISDCCHISSSQMEILRSARVAGEELSEEGYLDPGGPAVDSTPILMVSPPESGEFVRNDNIPVLTPQETYHTLPEESAPPSSASGEETIIVHCECQDSERAVDLGRDRGLGFAESSEGAAPGRHGLDQRFEMGKARALSRCPRLDECPSKKRKLLEINLRLDIPDALAGVLKEEIKVSLAKAVESLKNYGSTFRREIGEVTSTMRKLNLRVVIEDAPIAADLEVEKSDSISEDTNNTENGNDCWGLKRADSNDAEVIGTDITQMDHIREVRNVANVANKGKAVAEHEQIGIRGGAQEREYRDGSERREADRVDKKFVRNATVMGTDIAQRDREGGIKSVENNKKFRGSGDGVEDPHILNKGKAISECEEIGTRSGEKSTKAQPCNDREGKRSLEINRGVVSIQNIAVTGDNNCESSKVDQGLRKLASCFQEPAQNVSCPPNVTKVNLSDALKKVVEACGGHGLANRSILNVARKHGITFPGPNSYPAR